MTNFGFECKGGLQLLACLKVLMPSIMFATLLRYYADLALMAEE